MGNTQVTPIRPAIPPFINLAGKLVEGINQEMRQKTRPEQEGSNERAEDIICIYNSVTFNGKDRTHAYLICLSAIYVGQRLFNVCPRGFLYVFQCSCLVGRDSACVCALIHIDQWYLRKTHRQTGV